MSWESDPRTRVERTHSGVQLPSKCIQTGSNQDEDGEDSDENDDDDDIYIMMQCVSVCNEKLALS